MIGILASVTDGVLGAIRSAVINACVCGPLSNAHDRYGARIVWIAPLVMLLAPLRRFSPAANTWRA